MAEPKIPYLNRGKKFEPQGVSVTIKSHAVGLTVNEIMKRFASTRTIPDRGIPGQFLDTTKIPSLFDALNMRVSLNKYFMGLDSQTRALFNNDPLNIVKFVNDPKNFDKGLELGILKLNEAGLKAKAEFDKAQSAEALDKRKSFVADVSQILKDSGSGQSATNP